MCDSIRMIIINADDWGRRSGETDRALSCYQRGQITSVSAMVFMADSARGSVLAREHGLNAGLHLNLDERFEAPGVRGEVIEMHDCIRSYLRRSKYAQAVYNPMLRKKMEYVYKSQIEEFYRLYGKAPTHVDGHHHLHLCANMLFGRIIPRCMKLRGTFSFWPGEKSRLNRFYRKLVSRWLLNRHVVPDYFFSLKSCLASNRMEMVVELAKKSKVELMTHLCVDAEHAYLTSDDYEQAFRHVPKGSYATL
jgi:predicted glycoside hydrolase/deacetylase ChbG (UPF0249 family)